MVPGMVLPSQLDRYVFRQLGGALVAVTSALVALIWLTQSLRLVELVVNRGLSLRVFVHLTGLLVPGFVAVILPITTFVVVQFVYQRLAGDRELVVMRAAGLSPLALARPALAIALVAVAVGYALTLWLVPVSYSAFREYQFEIRNRLAAFLLQEGVFTPVSDDLTVYVRRRDTDGTLHGILRSRCFAGRQRDGRLCARIASGRAWLSGLWRCTGLCGSGFTGRCWRLCRCRGVGRGRGCRCGCRRPSRRSCSSPCSRCVGPMPSNRACCPSGSSSSRPGCSSRSRRPVGSG